MELTSEQEQQITQVYEAYWAHYLKGNIKSMEELLDESYTQVGSAESEVFTTKKEAIQFLKDTIDEVAGKLEMRNRITQKEQQDAIVMVHERCDLYALDGQQWVFYSKFRATTLFTERKNGWKIIHQHSSFPDSKTEKGQNVAIDKIAEENRELREAVKRRTVELELKNRELEIEAALEKVRSRTMSMQKSEELKEAATELYNQILNLGFEKVDSAGFIFPLPEENIQKCWFFETDSFLFSVFEIPYQGDLVLQERIEASNKGLPYLEQILTGKKLQNHMGVVMPESSRSLALEGAIEAMPSLTIFNMAFFKNGYINLISHDKLSNEEQSILIRFAKVFEQTYTRFLDLQKAEVQAREAQIEAAMERIRSRAITMRTSDELLEVALEMRIQTDRLGQQDLEASIVHLYEKDASFFESLAAMRTPGVDGEITTYRLKFPVNATKEIEQMIKNYWSGLSEYTIEVNLKMRKKWQIVLQKYAPELFNQRFQYEENEIEEDQIEYWNFADFSGGSLLTVTYSPPSPETKEFFKRSADVFDLAYRRYKDLQKAEAQTKEAQIEASLERVRSKAMAMHSSEDLTETVHQLFKELDSFDTNILRCGVTRVYETREVELFTYSRNKEGVPVPVLGRAMLEGHPVLDNCFKGWLEQKEFHATLEGKNLEAYYKRIKVNFKLPEAHNNVKHYGYWFYYPEGSLYTYTETPLTEDELKVYRRFNTVVGLTYRRYIDLQEAEAQTREAQIEAALERVRSKTMAMHNSQDVGATVVTLFDEVMKLGLDKSIRCGIGILEGTEYMETWSANYSPSGKIDLKMGILNMTIHPMLVGLKKAWKSKKKGYTYDFIGKDVIKYYTALNSEPNYPFNADLKTLPENVFHNSFFYSSGILFAFTENPISKEGAKVLNRFAKVFGQTYRRYLDLQKAEEQVREATIESALERVRASSMAMHKSEQLPETAQVLFEQFALLGNLPDRISICIIKEEEKLIELWATDQIGSQLDHRYSGSLEEATTISKIHKAWKEGKESIVIDLSGQKLKDWVRYIKEDVKLPIDDSNIKGRRVQQAAFFSKGLLLCTTNEPVADEIMQLLTRFAKVFDQTYTRFLDLQKAEAQTREAQIEFALERVRAKALAMHSSEELIDVSLVLREQMAAIGQNQLETIAIHFIPKDSSEFTAWFAFHPPGLEEREIKYGSVEFNNNETYYAREFMSMFRSKERNYLIEASGEHLHEWQEMLLARVPVFKELWKNQIPNHQYWYFSDFSGGNLMLITLEEASKEALELLRRSAQVFDLAYRRYLDLEKAETQAREAQIEAALEKVRGKAMAMHHSNDLVATASVVFSELKNLGINTFRSGVGLLTKENKEVELYAATSSDDGVGLSLVGKTILKDHPVLSQIYINWKRNKDYFPLLEGDLLKRYYEQIQGQYKVPTTQIGDNTQYGYFLPFSEGVFYGWSYEPFTETELSILHRFNAIIDLTFRRYIELQKAESNALDAVRRSSVDRVRAEIASMRSTGDLDRITPLIWNELTTLGVPFVRCGVFIFDEKEEQIHTFLSKPDGKAIAAFHLPYDSSPFVNAIENWRSKKIQVIHWDNEGFSELADTLIKEGQIATRQQYLSTVPKNGLYLHYLPFLQGILYVGNSTELDEDSLHLVQSIANAFSTAYARYEDFNKLEEAKQQVEQTLTDLKQTQQQLVQSEKMASLGELTAGIAHEIQNPLNFVNNFSEVSVELIEEMYEELEKGDLKEARAFADDVKQNLDKITHHGKRADGIVKGMLQHSRSSSGVKEPTDINALADEYLRLAYHGLRAKDKTFNATMKTDFDESTGKINVVPQDIGRVILNLITNAFYACAERSRSVVNERKKIDQTGYEPKVTVSTKKEGNQVLISVKDNGNGIPKKVLDKVFQPFFTTKPTGQGTGLGLSMSYDIVKAHGGELKVETNEGEGSQFIIILPA